YQVTMTLYRDTIGIPMYPTEDINISADTIAGTSPVIYTINAPPAINFGNGVEEYTYQLNVSFPAAGDYVIYWSNCCRNAAILNFPNPDTYGMMLYTKVHVDTANSTPVFLNPPIPIAQLGVPFTFNSLPFDTDGDSLAWRMEIPLNMATSGSGYLLDTIMGYVDPSSDTSMPFTLNSATSEISFLPNLQGHFVVSLAVDEFRGGQKIGEIRRDMQIIVVGSSNSPRLFNYTCNVAPTQNRTIAFAPNTTMHLSLNVSDPVDNDALNINAAGSAFMNANPPVFTTSAGANGAVNADLIWTPTLTEESAIPYITSFRIGESHGGITFYRDETFQLIVNRSVGIDDPQNFTNVNWSLQEGLLIGKAEVRNPGSVEIELLSVNGQSIRRYDEGSIQPGNHSFALGTGFLEHGIYLVRMRIGNEQVSTTKVIY
ncbi:MAG: hypothetical protein ACKOKF_03205, partial [Bacteroidota bacterium]